ncbi:LemA family protein [Mesomycoplasma molare]|uniref:LemA family protein n=1 Tax=Mesomycoplasma molare TaxID=171288 RepID=A0ABY5TU95_9BACT|nr:LemA family protein [Mesomycoplasma molare]UWD33884.1 LemA family protein [Mesomycoplasma molare]
MSNIYNPRNEDESGFEPKVDNSEKKAKVSIATKIIFWVLGTLFFLFAPIYFLVKRNNLNRMQNSINEASSTIDTQLAKRADTLIKLVDQVKSYKEYESSLLKDVTKLRTLINSNNTNYNREDIEQLSSKISRQISVAFESYPDLKASNLYETLMKESIYLEEEISAARRLYNSKVKSFNEQLFIFPASIVAESLNLTSMPLFKANIHQRQDVSMKDL